MRLRSLSLVLVFPVLAAACTSGDDGLGEPEMDAGDNDAGVVEDAGEADTGAEDTGGGEMAEPPPAFKCDPGAKTGMAGKANGLKTKGGLGFNVRTPADYDPTVGHPFIAIFAPASLSATETESFMGLTTAALARGYILAYADHRSPASEAILKLGYEMVESVVASYCVDPSRVYLAGHSDGGTISSGISIYLNPAIHPAAIGPSAPGLTAKMSDVPMQYPFSSLVIQSKNDEVFPGKGRKLAETLAAQAGCGATPSDPLPSGCIAWSGCKDAMDVQYCEGTGAHAYYLKKFNTALLDFFDAHIRR